MRKIIASKAIIVTLIGVPLIALAQEADMPPREETRGERMAREVEMAEQAKMMAEAQRIADEKYRKEQEEQFRKSAAALDELLKKYEAENRESKVKREAQMKVDAANYQRRNIVVGPILRFFDLFRGPQWTDKMRQQEEARQRARMEAERAKEEKAANEALRKAREKKLKEDAIRRQALQEALEAAQEAERLRRIKEEIDRANREAKEMKRMQEEMRKAIEEGLKKLGDDKKPKSLP